MTLATVSWSLKPPSERFPSGYGKVESLGSLGVSGLLLGGGFIMGWAAIIALCQQFFPEFAETAAHLGLIGHSHHGHSHSHADLGPNINAAWLAGGSILIKEWLYRASKVTRFEYSLPMLIQLLCSTQSRQRAQILRPRFQRISSPGRLSDGIRSPSYDCWIECS
jgi:divalent metal cation (Fe/Co/Zn/Cd) transporter